MDKQGKVTAIDVEAAHYDGPHVSPDGRRVAVDVVTGASLRDIYIIDTVVGTSSRLTLGGVENRTPIWMHDGHRLVYMAYDRAKNVSAIMIRSADGSGDAQQVAEVGGQAYAEDLTRDDATLVFSANPSTARGKFEIFRVSLQPGSTPEPEVSSPVGDVQNATLSPDGKWLAYYSAESGHPEVYVQSFASKSNRSQVSAAGGLEPRWAPDGSALYYQQADGLVRVPVETGSAFTHGKGQMIFSGAMLPAVSDSGQTYDIDPKSGRFLMLRPATEGAPTPDVHVIFNWFDELAKIRKTK